MDQGAAFDPFDRRGFLKTAGLLGVGASAGVAAAAPPSLRTATLNFTSPLKKCDADVGRQQHGFPPPEQLPM